MRPREVLPLLPTWASMCNVAAAARLGIYTAGSRCMLFFIAQITHKTSKTSNNTSETEIMNSLSELESEACLLELYMF